MSKINKQETYQMLIVIYAAVVFFGLFFFLFVFKVQGIGTRASYHQAIPLALSAPFNRKESLPSKFLLGLRAPAGSTGYRAH